MTKKLVKKDRKRTKDYESYLTGDPLFDLLSQYGLDSPEWRSIVDNDKKLQIEKKRKEINADRRYK